MEPITLIITQAGLDALVNAQEGSTDPIMVTHVGVTASAFTVAPTITALPGELKRLSTVSGQSASETIIHMTALDSSQDTYDVRGVGLYLQDGTLFAVYAQADPIFRKVAKTTFLFVQDIAFASAVGGSIVFGDALFLNPPASETIPGVAEVATQPEVDAGDDDSKIVTPLKLAARLATVMQALGTEAGVRADADDALAALITGASDRLDSGEFSEALTGNLAAKGHLDFPVGELTFRVNWGKTDVAAKTAATDTYDAQYSLCFGVFQGGGTSDVNSTEALRAYPGTGAQSVSHVNLTNGTNGLLTIHWLAIGLAA